MRSSYFPARLAPEKGLSKLKRRYQSVFTPGFTSFRISPREITIRRRITPKRGGFLDYPRSYYHDSYYVNYYHRFCDDKAMRSERRKMTGSARDRTSQRHVDLWATTPMSEVVFPILKTLKYNWPTRRDKGKRVVRRSRSDRSFNNPIYPDSSCLKALWLERPASKKCVDETFRSSDTEIYLLRMSSVCWKIFSLIYRRNIQLPV